MQDERMGLKTAMESNAIFPNEAFGLSGDNLPLLDQNPSCKVEGV